jgi:hypothetical protein
MELITNVKQIFLENKQKVLNGKLVGLPWYEMFPRLGAHIPVLPPATQIMFTGNSGTGKSHSWIGTILLTLYRLKKKYPDREFPIRFLISLLEDSKEDLITRLFSAIMLLKHGIRADGLMLNSRRGSPLPKEIEEKLDDVGQEIENLLSEHCEIIDNILNPTGLYKWGRAITNKLGTHHTKEMDFVDNEGNTYKQKVYSHYTPNNPDEQVIWIVDNLNNLQQESREGRLLTERETINRWTREYGRLQITKHWKFTLINIMQQAASSEAPQFNNRGELIIERVKPSLDGLGNSKECARDHILIFGVFAPSRYGIAEYGGDDSTRGYDISRMKDAYRSLIILKSNISETNKEIPMYFDGAASIYKELPPLSVLNNPDNRNVTNTMYQQIETRTLKV